MEKLTTSQIANEYDAVFAACTTEAELSAVISGIDFAPMTGALVAYITASATNAISRIRRAVVTPAVATPAAHPQRAETIARALAKNIYVTDAMVINSHTLRDVAADFISSYTGFNPFVQSVAIRTADTGVLSIPQMRGVLNVMIREAKEAAEDDRYLASIGKRRAVATDADTITITCASGNKVSAVAHLDAETLKWKHYYDEGFEADQAAEATDAGTPVYLDLRSTSERTVDAAGDPPAVEDQSLEDRRVPNGTYTIILDREADTYRTIRLADAPDYFNAAPGTQIASYLAGADNEGDYTGFAFVSGKQIKIWHKFYSADSVTVKPIDQALTILINSEDPILHMREYVLRSARCGVCGRKLTTPDSIRLGIGPICAGKLKAQGFVFEMPKEARAILAAVTTFEAASAAITQPMTKEERAEAARKALAAINELFD